ncbi:MAG: 2-hydroxyacid dehydrogenase [Pseudomonadales bacterium]
MSRPRVQLTRRWPAAVEQALAERYDLRINEDDVPLNRSALCEAFYWADAICPTVTDNLGSEFFAELNSERVRAQLLANYGVGFNHIDLASAAARQIAVTNTPGVLTEATADLALTLVLMVARRTGEGERQLRAGHWQGWRPTHLVGASVTGRTLGIIGMGRIGQALARKAQRGLDMHVLYYSRSALAADADVQAERCSNLEDLLARSDFVSLHCPSNAETRHLLNAHRLAQCRPSAFVINTARGDVLDEAALAAALEQGVLAGAGLDVYADEPQVNAALLAREDVVLLPHLGSATVEAREAMGFRAMSNLDAFFADDKLPDKL